MNVTMMLYKKVQMELLVRYCNTIKNLVSSAVL